MPLRVWFLGIFLLGRHKKGISALQFQRDSGVGSYQTAWTLLHKSRSGLGAQLARRLTGAVEADETYMGAYRPGRDGRGVGKTGVAIAVERRVSDVNYSCRSCCLTKRCYQPFPPRSHPRQLGPRHPP